MTCSFKLKINDEALGSLMPCPTMPWFALFTFSTPSKKTQKILKPPAARALSCRLAGTRRGPLYAHSARRQLQPGVGDRSPNA